MGFVNHGGMWSDLVLLSMANAVILPYLTIGWWIAAAAAISTLASVWAHIHWYGATRPQGPQRQASATDRQHGLEERVAASGTERRDRRGDHMWPARVHGTWWRDLSWAGWAHVVYVSGELTILLGFTLHPVPADVVLFVAVIFTIHVPIGLLQPRWFLTGHIATVQEQPLLAPLLLALWAATMVKL